MAGEDGGWGLAVGVRWGGLTEVWREERPRSRKDAGPIPPQTCLVVCMEGAEAGSCSRWPLGPSPMAGTGSSRAGARAGPLY